MSAAAIYHVGLTVSDIDATGRFYRRLGFKVPTESVRSAHRWFGEWVGHPGAIARLGFMQCGDLLFELHEYENPSGLEAIPPSTLYVGCAHVAVKVDDVWGLYEELAAEGVEFLGTPVVIDEGRFVGYVGVYCRDPDGYIVELVQLPPDGGMNPDHYTA